MESTLKISKLLGGKDLTMIPARNGTRFTKSLRASFLALVFGIFAFATCGAFYSASAETPEDLTRSANQALHMLTSSNPLAADLSKKAMAMIIFPNIVKAGLIFGGAYGEGVLMEGGKVGGYYNSVTASWGFQAGAQSYGYVVFLMNNKALDYIRQSHGLGNRNRPNGGRRQ